MRTILLVVGLGLLAQVANAGVAPGPNTTPVRIATIAAVPIQGGNATPVTVQNPLGDLTPIHGSLSINATTPVTIGTPDPKVVVVHWGYIASFGGGGTVYECNSTGTPGAAISGVETYLSNPAVVQAQHWLISSNGTPTTRTYTLWRRP